MTKKLKDWWNRFISSEILPIVFGVMMLLATFSGIVAVIIFLIKSILTMLGVI